MATKNNVTIEPAAKTTAEISKSKAMKSIEPPDTEPETTLAVGTAATQAPSAKVQDMRWQEIRLILEKLKEDTVREIRKSVKNGTEAVAAIEPGGDIYDQASSERDRELGLLLGDREREKIHSIDEALLRINEGDYGICEECDEDIPLGRLKAMPFTRHCVKCKSDLEKLQAQTKRVEEERAYREIPLGAEDEES
ncbi:MAG: TraR/DksA family transcriptional regulator [Desulfuromonadaceae bacterium]